MRYLFNEFLEQTIDFTDPNVVEEYDKKQGSSIEEEKKLVKELGITNDDTVIEYGPGTGALSIAIAEIGKRVYSVDTSKAMLGYLLKSANALGYSNITTHHAGFLSYQHCGDPVDHIVTKFAFHHLPDFWKSIALLNFNRYLRLGGKLFIQDVIFSFDPSNYENAIDSWINQMTESGLWSREAFETHVNEEFSTYSWILEGMLRSSGFAINKMKYTDTYGSLFCTKIRNLDFTQ